MSTASLDSKASKTSKKTKQQDALRPSSSVDARGIQMKDTSLIAKLCACAQMLTVRTGDKFKMVDEVPHLPTVALDLDGTLVHTLVDPIKIAVAEKSGLTTFRLPGNMGIVAQRPHLEKLFAALTGYNVVLFSAGGSIYINIVVERLLKSNPIFQGVFCKVLARPALTRYSETSEMPSETPLSKEGICYVKDLRKARADGNCKRVLIVDDNPYAFEVQPHMKDDQFRKLHDFTLHAVPVPDFQATSPNAILDRAFIQVSRMLREIVGEADLLAALASHPDQADLRAGWMQLPFERSPTSPGFTSECPLPAEQQEADQTFLSEVPEGDQTSKEVCTSDCEEISV